MTYEYLLMSLSFSLSLSPSLYCEMRREVSIHDKNDKETENKKNIHCKNNEMTWHCVCSFDQRWEFLLASCSLRESGQYFSLLCDSLSLSCLTCYCPHHVVWYWETSDTRKPRVRHFRRRETHVTVTSKGVETDVLWKESLVLLSIKRALTMNPLQELLLKLYFSKLQLQRLWSEAREKQSCVTTESHAWNLQSSIQ